MDFENDEKSDALFSDHYDDDFFKDATGNELVPDNNTAKKISLNSSDKKSSSSKPAPVAVSNPPKKNNERFDYLAFGKEESEKSEEEEEYRDEFDDNYEDDWGEPKKNETKPVLQNSETFGSPDLKS